jgi:hypothetical protein
MPFRPIRLVLFILAAVVGSRVGNAAPLGEALLAGQGGGAASPAQAAEQVRRQTGGKVLSVRERDGGYEVKVLTASGEVRSVFIPASRR